MTLLSRAWMLDPVAFHQEFQELSADHTEPDELVDLRERAAGLWRSEDPIVRTYVGMLRTAGADEWETSVDASHVADWYRVLMASHLTPTRAVRSPELLRRRLPELGWSPSEARRFVLGRDLQLLAQSYAAGDRLGPLSPQVIPGYRGWLSQDDIDAASRRLRSLDRASFQLHQDLVPVVENLYEVLEAAATKPDHVLLLISD